MAEEFLDQLRSGPRTGCWGRGEIRLREGFGWGGIRLYQHLRLQERRPFCSNLCLVFEVRCSTFRRGWDGSDRVHGWFASSIPQNLALLNLPRGPGAEGHAVRLTSTSPRFDQIPFKLLWLINQYAGIRNFVPAPRPARSPIETGARAFPSLQPSATCRVGCWWFFG